MINSSGYFGVQSPLPDTSASDLELLYESADGSCILLKGHRNDRFVAYKCLKSEYRNDPVQQRMLRREYEIGASLKHPGVCEVLDWVSLPEYGDGIEMEYIDGQRLDEWLAAGRRPVPEQRRVLCELCDALSYIHRKQVIHKDIKPENILVTKNGDYPKIIDFGLSDSGSILTGKDPAGTLQYAAPEVIAGDAANERSDIYSLGCIIREMSPAFSRIAGKCTESAPGKRYAGADEIRDAIANAGKPRRPWILPAIAALLAAGLLALYFLTERDPVEELFLDAVEQVRDASNPV